MKPVYRKKPKQKFSYSAKPVEKISIETVEKEMVLRFYYWSKNLPLSVGFVNELIAHYKSKLSVGTHHLRRMMSLHCRTKEYLKNIREGKARFDFNGNKTTRVTKEQEDQAKLYLKKLGRKDGKFKRSQTHTGSDVQNSQRSS